MSLKLIQQSIIPLFIATLFIGLFYFQFQYIYPFIIENFRDAPLLLVYSHLFLYIFLVLVLFTSLINLINHFILKSKIFITINILVILMFYLFFSSNILDILNYFISYPFNENSIMGIILFMVASFGYTLYSMGILFFNRFIPLSHIFVFLLISLIYTAFFIDIYCYPIEDFFNKF
jgi:hypothetical protein